MGFCKVQLWRSRASADKDVLHVAGNSVQQVKRRRNKIFIGDARVVTADLGAGKSVVHIVDTMLGNCESQPADVTKPDASAVQAASKLIDAEFLDESKHQEIAEGIAEWNIPGFQANRDLVAHPDGGLHNPVALTFDASFNTQDFSKPIQHFTYPVLGDGKRPDRDDGLAFMTVLQLDSLIRSKQVTTVELVKLYIERLKKWWKFSERKGVKMVPFNLKYSVSTAQFTLKITMEVDVLAHFDH